MQYSVYITPTALIDIDDAVTYYDSKALELGARFVEDLETNLAVITQNPDAFTKRYKDVRGKLFKRFPYLILYRSNHSKQSIEVLRIFNTYQNPYWI